MAVHLFRLKPLSALATPLRSDTLYGHLLWAAAEWDGESAVENLIEQFAAGEPPFVVSSAFPAGMLPMPAVPTIPRANFTERFVGSGKRFPDKFSALTEFKRFRKKSILPVSIFKKLQSDFSMVRLFEVWLNDKESFEPYLDNQMGERLPWSVVSQTPHNSIDRSSGAVRTEGGLFFTEEVYHCPGAELDLYVRADDIEVFKQLMVKIVDSGFGRDRSTGKGQFSCQEVAGEDFNWLDSQSSHLLNLSVCSASEIKGFEALGKPFTKHGRAWNPSAGHPFKKPFLAFGEGSVLTRASFENLPKTGFLLRNVHADPRIVQVVLPLCAPITLSQPGA